MTRTDFKKAVAASTGLRFLAYVRTSAFASPKTEARQRASIRAYLASVGARPAQIEVDRAHADVAGERPGLARLLRAIEQGRCTDVVVEDVDRMMRDVYEASEIRALLKRARVRLHVTGRGTVTEGPRGPDHRAEADRLRRSALARDELARARSRRGR